MNKAAERQKRKSTDATAFPSKHARSSIETFFTPQIAASSHADNHAVVHLNSEQNRVLRRVVDEGTSVFITGAAGAGKSLLLRAIITALKRKHADKPDAVAVTSSTGMAASNIGGMTLHAWGAIAPNVTCISSLVSYIKVCKPALRRWKYAKVLVVDEVSMVDGHLFSRLASVAAEIRNEYMRPFGGIQLVVTGDFFQLPPIAKRGEDPFFAFESAAWTKCIAETVVLKKVWRQTDSRFVSLLNEMRKGALSPSAAAAFRTLARPLPPAPQPAIELFPTRVEVLRANAAHLARIPVPPVLFMARDTGGAAPERRVRLLEDTGAPERLEVKVGAVVMLVKNCDSEGGLVNGCVGRILGFYTREDVGGAGKEGAKLGALFRNVKLGGDGRPLRKVDRVDKENVAVRSEIPKVEGKGKRRESGTAELWPLIEFEIPGVGQGNMQREGKEIVLLGRDEFRVEDADGKLLARRLQVPLVLAWAMSIHKSQGQTINRLKIDLRRVFEKGQSYVALSRAKSLDGLQVLGFDPKKVVAHPKVIEWAKNLEENVAEEQIPSHIMPITMTTAATMTATATTMTTASPLQSERSKRIAAAITKALLAENGLATETATT